MSSYAYTKQTPFRKNFTAPGGLAPTCMQLFAGVKLNAKGGNRARLVVSVLPASGITGLINAVTLTDGLTNPTIQDVLPSPVLGDVPLVYEMRWGSEISGIVTPGTSGAGFVQSYNVSAPSNGFPSNIGLQADANIGGQPDPTGTLAAFLAVSSNSSGLVKVTANLITWSD
jgi:hypothetical protein